MASRQSRFAATREGYEVFSVELWEDPHVRAPPGIEHVDVTDLQTRFGIRLQIIQ